MEFTLLKMIGIEIMLMCTMVVLAIIMVILHQLTQKKVFLDLATVSLVGVLGAFIGILVTLVSSGVYLIVFVLAFQS